MGYEEQRVWLKRCDPDLPNFVVKDWQDCISEKSNPHYLQCKELMQKELEKNNDFYDAFFNSVDSYIERHGTSRKNGEQYILEKISWIYNLPLVHLNKHIYLLHVGKINPVIKKMFEVFPNFNKAVKWLSPRFKTFTFRNEAEFLMYYNSNVDVGCSYIAENKGIIKKFKSSMQAVDLKKKASNLGFENMETGMFQYIIEQLPAHIYWLNRENIYLGCNKVQAKALRLKSEDEIIGKTNSDFHEKSVADNLNTVNEFVMSTGKPYEGEEPAFIGGKFGNCFSSKIPILNVNGKCVGLLGISFDITQKKQIEELENRLKLQKELYNIAKQMANEVDSPITALKMIEYMSMNRLSEKEMRILKMAIESIETVANTLSGLKMVSRTPVDCELPEEERKELDTSIANVRRIANTLLQRYIEVQEANFEKTASM
ncbi:MAG: PAS domain-containing protein [Endomicrobium sp.]|jgi:PAS domain-containing protein|nr:PAS domain-containing protein [Endomicrobium sp.]